MTAGARILVVRFSSLGDVILTTPVLQALADRYPERHVTYATKRAYAPLLRADPLVDRVVALEPDEHLAHYLARLDDAPYDLALDLHRSLRSAVLRRRIPAPWRTFRKGRLARWRAVWIAPPAEGPHVTERFMRAFDGDRPAPPPRLVCGRDAVDAAAAVPGERLVALAPGASRANKQWPAAQWHTLARRLSDAGYTPVGVGLPAEARLLPAPHVVPAYDLPLDATIALLARCRAVVAHDSGLLHAAGAVGTPAVALYGPTHPAAGYGPRGSPHRIMSLDLRCRPCSVLGGPDCPRGGRPCLERLDPDAVADAVRAVA